MPVAIANPVGTIQINGSYRRLGTLPVDKTLLRPAKFTDKFAVDSELWKPVDLQTPKVLVRDQGPSCSAVGCACVTALEYAMKLAGKTPAMPLSGAFPYAQVSGGRDEGATVFETLMALHHFGTCSLAECPDTQGIKAGISKKAYATAEQNKVPFEYYSCATFEEMCEALNQGFVTVFGLKIGANFNRLSRSGAATLPAAIAGGQAFCGMGLKHEHGSWSIKAQNSWSKNWGLHGFVYLTRGLFIAKLLDAFAIKCGGEATEPVLEIHARQVRNYRSEAKAAQQTSGATAINMPEQLPAPKPVEEAVPVPTVDKVRDVPDILRDQAMARMLEKEDQKFIEAINKPILEAAPELVPPASLLDELQELEAMEKLQKEQAESEAASTGEEPATQSNKPDKKNRHKH